MVPNAVTKTGDTSRASSTTLTADPDLVLPVAANTTFGIHFVLIYEGGTLNASDIKMQWTAPAGATVAVCVPAYFFTDGNTHGPAYIDQTTVLANGTSGAGVVRAVFQTGSVTTGSTAGNLSFKWAQNTSSATATIVHAQSTLSLQRTS